MNDSSFLDKINSGRDSGYEELVRRYYNMLCAQVAREMNRRLRQREDPNDAVQSALRVFKKGMDTKGWHIERIGQLLAMLRKLTRRAMRHHIDYHLTDKRHPKHETPSDGDRCLSREPFHEDGVVVADLIQHVLNGLEPTYGKVLYWRLRGKTRKEIAVLVRCTESQVRAKLDRLKSRLRQLLQPLPASPDPPDVDKCP